MDSSRTWLSRIFLALLAPLVALAVVVAPLSIPTAHAQDSRAQARAHYQTGSKLYADGEYQRAIAEFAAADKLAPSPMLEFNIALCYDNLGDRAEALRRYRIYLKAMPSASNRGTVEGKIRRLEGELRTEADARRKTADAKAAADASAAAAAAAAAASAVPTPTPTPGPAAVPTPTPAPLPTPAPEVYTPGAAAPAPADPQLARVAAIDVAAIRDQRRGSGYGSQNQYPDQSQYGADNDAQDPRSLDSSSGAAEPIPSAPTDKKKASKPIYKQWWFWVVVGVSTLILIDFATSDSSSSNTARREFMPAQGMMAAPASGPLEWRF